MDVTLELRRRRLGGAVELTGNDGMKVSGELEIAGIATNVRAANRTSAADNLYGRGTRSRFNARTSISRNYPERLLRRERLTTT